MQVEPSKKKLSLHKRSRGTEGIRSSKCNLSAEPEVAQIGRRVTPETIHNSRISTVPALSRSTIDFEVRDQSNSSFRFILYNFELSTLFSGLREAFIAVKTE